MALDMPPGKTNIGQKPLFYLQLGCFLANFGSLSRGRPHSPEVNHYINQCIFSVISLEDTVRLTEICLKINNSLAQTTHIRIEKKAEHRKYSFIQSTIKILISRRYLLIYIHKFLTGQFELSLSLLFLFIWD